MTRYVDKKGYREYAKTEYRARHAYDLYSTPPEVIDALFDHSAPPSTATVLEPCAGEGNIVRYLLGRGYRVHAIEIQPHLAEALQPLCPTLCHDFLTVKMDPEMMKRGKINAIMTNPPFDIMFEFAVKCVGLGLDYVALLMPTGFLHSKKRYQFNRDYPVTGLFPLSDRIKYDLTVKSHPPRDQSWFVWDRREPKLFIQPLAVLKKQRTKGGQRRS